MISRFVITGTDTGIGKTMFAAALADALDGYYWKPVQAGLDTETDSECVARLGRIPVERIVPEAYRLSLPASPHLTARQQGVTINAEKLALPTAAEPLVIEGAGGVMVPLSETMVFADIFAAWRLPVILCARTSLGTINHSLLTLEALKARAIPVCGVAFIGADNRESRMIISTMGSVRDLGCLPWLETVDADRLRRAFHDNFDLSFIREISQ